MQLEDAGSRLICFTFVLNMKPNDFIYEIIDLYRRARRAKYDHDKLRRGRSHSVSSAAEDLLALYLISNDPSIDMIRTDQPITIPTNKLPGKKSFQVYPDLVIFRNDRIDALVDLKMDLGWARNRLPDICKKHAQTVSLACGRVGWLRDGYTKKREKVRFATSLRYCVVIVSDKNISANQIADQYNTANSVSNRVDVVILSSGAHPNHQYAHSGFSSGNLTVLDNQFEQLLTLAGGGRRRSRR